MPGGLNMGQLAQLNAACMNPLHMNLLGVANLSAMGISPKAQLLAAQIAAAAGGFGQTDLGLGGGLGGFVGMQEDGSGRGGPGRSGGRSPGLSANGKSGSSSSAAGGNNDGGGAKKDEEDFDPAVLNDVAGWLRSLRLHKYTPNFEGMSWKEMVLMDEQALEAQGIAALVRGGKRSRLSRSSGGKWGPMIRWCLRPLRHPLVRPRHRPRLLLGARLVVVVGYPRHEQS